MSTQVKSKIREGDEEMVETGRGLLRVGKLGLRRR